MTKCRAGFATGRQATITSHIQAQFVIVDKTVDLLRSMAESNEEDRLEWEAIAQHFLQYY